MLTAVKLVRLLCLLIWFWCACCGLAHTFLLLAVWLRVSLVVFETVAIAFGCGIVVAFPDASLVV